MAAAVETEEVAKGRRSRAELAEEVAPREAAAVETEEVAKGRRSRAELAEEVADLVLMLMLKMVAVPVRGAVPTTLG